MSLMNLMEFEKEVEMKKCVTQGCSNDAEFIDSQDNYSCSDCMHDDIENEYTGQVDEDYEWLDWEIFPKNGYSE